MKRNTKLADRGNYGDRRATGMIRYIVVHYTANDGDTDENNGAYFHSNRVGSSAHYFVDSDSVTQSVPDDHIAWHCGASSYKHAACRNANSIGVELCDDVRNGAIRPSEKTVENAVELVRQLMKKYSVPAGHVIRHYDVTGKLCPAYWCGSAAKDALWKSEFRNRLQEDDMTKQDVIKIIGEYEAEKAGQSVDSWARASWTKARAKGVLDGTKPKSAPTREQLAVILDRLGLLD